MIWERLIKLEEEIIGVLNKKIGGMYFTRFILTGREFDDTAKYNSLDISTEIMYKINILSQK